MQLPSCLAGCLVNPCFLCVLLWYTGVVRLLREDDYVCSTYRDHVHALSKGVPAREVRQRMKKLVYSSMAPYENHVLLCSCVESGELKMWTCF